MRHGAALAIAIVLLAPGVGRAQTPAPLLGGYEYGLICPQVELGRRAAPGTASGDIGILPADTGIAIRTTEVPARLGMEFGVRLKLRAGMDETIATVLTLHPPYGADGITRETWTTRVSDSDWSLIAFSFDKPFELVEGVWSFEAHAGGRQLFRQEFNVTSDSLIDLDAVCPEADLLS